MMIRILLILSTATVAALSIPAGSTGRSKVLKVWDNVLPREDQRAALHEYASKSGLEHKCFSRPLDTNRGNNNIIERTLDAILSEMEAGSGNDNENIDSNNKQYVEYWTRQEWRHIEAHADVDENLSKQMDQGNSLTNDGGDLQSKYSTTYQGQYGHRYPTYGHVLYLQVGTDVQGPTCIFPGRSSGGDLTRELNNEQSESAEECSDDSENTANEVQLITVPAVAGRLLRFDGRDLHAVPRPADLWMLPFVRGGAEYEPEEVWGRSVILFNVWPAGEEPPLDVPLNVNAEDSLTAKAEDPLFCNSFEKWNEVEIDQEVVPSSSSNTETNQSVKVWLLGNERRRDHPLRTVALKAPVDGGRDAVRQALAEKSKVSELLLRQQ